MISRNLLACTGNEKDCPVHSVDGKSPTWWWIDSQEKVPQLIDALNPRGFRESLLKTNISHFRQRINDCIHKSLLAKVIPVPPVTEEFRDTFELTLRDVLLEVEEKIFLGGLGSPHVSFSFTMIIRNFIFI